MLPLWLQTHFLCMSPGTDDFGRLAARAVDAIMQLNATGGLPPFLLDPVSGAAEPSAPISLGARGDSYVEYLLKGWLIGSKRDDALLRCVSLHSCHGQSPKRSLSAHTPAGPIATASCSTKECSIQHRS